MRPWDKTTVKRDRRNLQQTVGRRAASEPARTPTAPEDGALRQKEASGGVLSVVEREERENTHVRQQKTFGPKVCEISPLAACCYRTRQAAAERDVSQSDSEWDETF